MARPKTMLAPKPGKDQLIIKPQHKSVNEALAGVHKAGGYTGFLNDGNIITKPDFVEPTEQLSESDKARKKAVTDLLMNVIEPVQLSSKSTPEADRRSLFNKLKKTTLENLRGFLPDTVNQIPTEQLKADVLSDEQKAEIQDLYKDISP